MDSERQDEQRIPSVGTNTKIVKAYSIAKLRRMALKTGKLSKVVIPVYISRRCERRLYLALAANRPLHIITHEQINKDYFTRSGDTYSFNPSSPLKFKGKGSVSISQDALKAIAEACCRKNGRPLWVEGTKVEKIYYIMVIESLKGNLMEKIFSPKEIEAPMLQVDGKKGAIMNDLAKLENSMVELVSKYSTLSESNSVAFSRIRDYSKRLIKQMQIARSFAGSDTSEIDQISELVKKFLEGVLNGKYTLTARERAIQLAKRNGQSTKEIESRLVHSPFRDTEDSSSAFEFLKKDLEDLIENTSRINLENAQMDPSAARPYDDPRRRKNSEDVLDDEKDLAERIRKLVDDGRVVSREIIFEALDSGWVMDFEKKLLSNPRHPNATVIEPYLHEFLIHPTATEMKAAAENQSNSILAYADPDSEFESKLKNQEIQRLTTDSHKLSTQDAIRLVALKIYQRSAAGVEASLEDGVSHLSESLFRIARKERNIAPNTAILQSEILVYTKSLVQADVPTGVLESLKQGIRYKLSSNDADTAIGIAAYDIGKEWFKNNSSKILETLSQFIAIYLFGVAVLKLRRKIRVIGNLDDWRQISRVYRKEKLVTRNPATAYRTLNMLELNHTLERKFMDLGEEFDAMCGFLMASIQCLISGEILDFSRGYGLSTTASMITFCFCYLRRFLTDVMPNAEFFVGADDQEGKICGVEYLIAICFLQLLNLALVDFFDKSVDASSRALPTEEFDDTFLEQLMAFVRCSETVLREKCSDSTATALTKAINFFRTANQFKNFAFNTENLRIFRAFSESAKNGTFGQLDHEFSKILQILRENGAPVEIIQIFGQNTLEKMHSKKEYVIPAWNTLGLRVGNKMKAATPNKIWNVVNL